MQIVPTLEEPPTVAVQVDGRRRWYKPWEHPFHRMAMEAGLITVTSHVDLYRLPKIGVGTAQITLVRRDRTKTLGEWSTQLVKSGYTGANLYQVLALVRDGHMPEDAPVVASGTLGQTANKNLDISPLFYRTEDGISLGTLYWDVADKGQPTPDDFYVAVVPIPPRPKRRPYGT